MLHPVFIVFTLSNKTLYYDNSKQMIGIGWYKVSIQSSQNSPTCTVHNHSLH